MKKLSNPTTIFILIVLLGIVTFFVLNEDSTLPWFNDSKETKKSDSTLLSPFDDLQEEREKWLARIDKVGGHSAYEDFKNEYSVSGIKRRHFVAHVFGTLLYEKLGMQGLIICDTFGFFGCYRGFFVNAVNHEGLSSLSAFENICKEMSGADLIDCRHSIGHIVLFQIGENKLEEALEMCAQFYWQEELGGCTDGVFKEYALGTLSDPLNLGLNLRSFNPHEPYAPCHSISEKFLESCYFSLPRWWATVLEGDFVKIGKLCSEVTQESLRQICFRSMGNYAMLTSNFSEESAAAFCTQMPSQEGATFCIEGIQERRDHVF